MAWLEGVQRIVSNGGLRWLFTLDRKLQDELDDVLKQEEILWYQKSRERWIQVRDRSTKFFHSSTLICKEKNRTEWL